VAGGHGTIADTARAESVELELGLIQTHMIQKPIPRVEVFTRALRASQNVNKKRDACLVCSLCLSGYMGVFSEDVLASGGWPWRHR